MKKVFAGVFLLVAALAAGCGRQEQPVQVGDRTTYIDAAKCDEPSRKLIAEKQLMLIHSCASETIKLENGSQGQYAIVAYGPGLDCPSGCIYERAAAIVLPDRIAMVPKPFRRDDLLLDDINQQWYVSLPADLLKSADRHFREKDGQWQMILTFRKYLKGYVIAKATDERTEAVWYGPSPEDVKANIREKLHAQCNGPVGIDVGQFLKFQPREDGVWIGSIRWGLDNRLMITAFTVSPAGVVTFPEGCGK